MLRRAVPVSVVATTLLLLGAGAAHAGGSDGPTPYTVTPAGVTLPRGTTFGDDAHVNVHYTVGSRSASANLHTGGAGSPQHRFARAGSVSWADLGITGAFCVTWVEVSGFNEHFGEGGQTPVCVTPSKPAPSPCPTYTAPTVPPVPTPAPSSPAPTTPAPSTPAPTAPAPSTPAPSTPAPAPSTPAPVPSTPAPTPPAASTAAPLPTSTTSPTAAALAAPSTTPSTSPTVAPSATFVAEVLAAGPTSTAATLATTGSSTQPLLLVASLTALAGIALLGLQRLRRSSGVHRR